jgi:hypothetical protein
MVLSLLVSTTVFAEKGDVDLFIGSYTDHIKNKTYGYPAQTKNDANYGIGISYEVIDDLDVTARVFSNSVDQTSVALNVGYTFLKFQGIEFNIQEQAATGYSVAYSNGRRSNDMYYKTNLGVCYNTKEIDMFDKHSPKLCATTKLAGSGGKSFDQVNFYILIPLTNLLQ